MIPFAKAHACGNDFLIVTAEAAQGCDWAALTRTLCERNTSVGADGIEFFKWTGPQSGVIRLHNADGSIAEISGNGTRCVAAWMARERSAKPGDLFTILTDAGERVCQIDSITTEDEYTVKVTTGMGVPAFRERIVTMPGGVQVRGVEVNTGNPHFVIRVDNAEFSVDGQGWPSIGQQICFHPDFPNQTNVEFIRIIGSSEVELRIFERGVGPTSSSGTGTSAAATAAIGIHGCASPLTVTAPGGAQIVHWGGPDHEISLTGPASIIAVGEAYTK